MTETSKTQFMCNHCQDISNKPIRFVLARTGIGKCDCCKRFNLPGSLVLTEPKKIEQQQ